MSLAIKINPRAHDRFPGQVYNEQQRRFASEKKHRDWDGWLKLVMDRKAELRAHPETGAADD